MVIDDCSLKYCEPSKCSIVELIYNYHHGGLSHSCLTCRKMLSATCLIKMLSILSRTASNASRLGFQTIRKKDLANYRPGHRTHCASLVLFRAERIWNRSCIQTSRILN